MSVVAEVPIDTSMNSSMDSSMHSSMDNCRPGPAKLRS